MMQVRATATVGEKVVYDRIYAPETEADLPKIARDAVSIAQ